MLGLIILSTIDSKPSEDTFTFVRPQNESVAQTAKTLAQLQGLEISSLTVDQEKIIIKIFRNPLSSNLPYQNKSNLEKTLSSIPRSVSQLVVDVSRFAVSDILETASTVSDMQKLTLGETVVLPHPHRYDFEVASETVRKLNIFLP